MSQHEPGREGIPEREEESRYQYPPPPGTEDRLPRSPQSRPQVALPPIRDGREASNGYPHPMTHHGPPPPSNGYNGSPSTGNGYPPPPAQAHTLPSLQPSAVDQRSPGYPAHAPPPPTPDPRDPYYDQRRAYERDPYYSGGYRSQLPPPPPPPDHGRDYPREYARDYGRQPPPPPRDDYYRSHPPPPRHDEYGRPPPGYDEYGRPPPRPPYDAEYARGDPRNGYPQYAPQAPHQMQQAAPRQRTSIACRYCRKRKIRCSGYQNAPGGRCVNCARMNQECIFQPVSSSSSATFVHVSAVAGGIAPGTQLYGAYGQPIATDQHGPPQGMPGHAGPGPPPRSEHGPHNGPPGPPGPPPASHSGPPPPAHHHAYPSHPPPPPHAAAPAHGPPPPQSQSYPPPHTQPGYYPLPMRSPTDTYSSYADSDAASSSGRRRRRESNEGHERRLPPPSGNEDDPKRRSPVSGSNSPEGGYQYPSQAPIPAPRSRGHTPPGSAPPLASGGAAAGPPPAHHSPVTAHPGRPSNQSPGVSQGANGSTTPTKAAAPPPAQGSGNRASSVMNLRSLIDSRPTDSGSNDIDNGMLGRLNHTPK